MATSTSKACSAVPAGASPAALEPDHPDRDPDGPVARGPPSEVDFSDSASAHGRKTTSEIIRAIAVFHACRLPPLVKHAEGLLAASERMLGRRVADALVRHTFFDHFCAGEDGADTKPVIDRLRENRIGPILDYAAESEGSQDGVALGGVEAKRRPSDACSDSAGRSLAFLLPDTGIFTQPPFNQPARVYDYKSEGECDRHVEVFKSCIRSVRDASPAYGFAALKVTALGNPELLERMSTAIVEAKNLFSKFDEKGSGLISREEFVRCYRKYFHAGDEKLAEIIKGLDRHSSGAIDYVSFSQMFTPYALPEFTSRCKDVGPLALATPSDDEIALMRRTSERLRALAEEAARCGTRLLVDAEHRKYQPAIDGMVLELQRKYNASDRTPRPLIFNTYQCYLKDTPERLIADLRRSELSSFHFAAKLVRGAYMVHERKRAKELRYESPIHDTADDTHHCYDQAIKLLLRHRRRSGPGSEIMIATHNGKSIEKAVKLMGKLGLDPGDESVHFAQLYGMSDNITFTLGKHGYNAFKYLPYGKVREVVPYLVRRAQENGDVLGNAGKELSLLREELRNRLLLLLL